VSRPFSSSVRSYVPVAHSIAPRGTAGTVGTIGLHAWRSFASAAGTERSLDEVGMKESL